MDQPHTKQAPPVSKAPTPPVSGPLASFEAWLYELFVVKAPYQLPKGFTDWLVTYGPWITLVLAILCVPLLITVLAVLGIAAVAQPLMAVTYDSAYDGAFLYWIYMLLLCVQIVIMFVAVPKLLRRERRGWLLMFYAELLDIVTSVLNLTHHPITYLSSIVGILIGAVISYYVLFQIRHYYVK